LVRVVPLALVFLQTLVAAAVLAGILLFLLLLLMVAVVEALEINRVRGQIAEVLVVLVVVVVVEQTINRGRAVQATRHPLLHRRVVMAVVILIVALRMAAVAVVGLAQ
jgi:hypothetical protein